MIRRADQTLCFSIPAHWDCEIARYHEQLLDGNCAIFLPGVYVDCTWAVQTLIPMIRGPTQPFDPEILVVTLYCFMTRLGKISMTPIPR